MCGCSVSVVSGGWKQWCFWLASTFPRPGSTKAPMGPHVPLVGWRLLLSMSPLMPWSRSRGCWCFHETIPSLHVAHMHTHELMLHSAFIVIWKKENLRWRPNLECWPHLLIIKTMMRRKVQANRARPTATETCPEGEKQPYIHWHVTTTSGHLSAITMQTHHKNTTFLILSDVRDWSVCRNWGRRRVY